MENNVLSYLDAIVKKVPEEQLLDTLREELLHWKE